MIVGTDAGLYPVEIVQAELAHLARLATVLLDEHVNEAGLCVVCGCAFPCRSAVLAEHNIALL